MGGPRKRFQLIFESRKNREYEKIVHMMLLLRISILWGDSPYFCWKNTSSKWKMVYGEYFVLPIVSVTYTIQITGSGSIQLSRKDMTTKK